jgi:hypothetical protein
MEKWATCPLAAVYHVEAPTLRGVEHGEPIGESAFAARAQHPVQ